MQQLTPLAMGKARMYCIRNFLSYGGGEGQKKSATKMGKKEILFQLKKKTFLLLKKAAKKSYFLKAMQLTS